MLGTGAGRDGAKGYGRERVEGDGEGNSRVYGMWLVYGGSPMEYLGATSGGWVPSGKWSVLSGKDWVYRLGGFGG